MNLHPTCTSYSNVCYFFIKTIRHSCLLDDHHKFIANVTDKITSIHYFALYKRSNVATFEGSIKCRTLVYANDKQW